VLKEHKVNHTKGLVIGRGKIHPTAIIADSVQLGQSVVIGAYSIIEGHVTIGDNTQIGNHVHIKGPTTIGKDNIISSFSSIEAVLRLILIFSECGGDPINLIVCLHCYYALSEIILANF
jgi:NDP-sugar pyrophosphorylase family protein